MSLLTASNPLQVAMVRLRLESVPFKVVHRGDFEGPSPGGYWPFKEDSCVLFCRTTLTAGERAPTVDITASYISPGYVLSDGVERPFFEFVPDDPIRLAALELRGGTWFASGGNW